MITLERKDEGVANYSNCCRVRKTFLNASVEVSRVITDNRRNQGRVQHLHYLTALEKDGWGGWGVID